MKFQNGISSYVEHGGRRTLPYVYTEQGIAMLSAVLRSDVAIQVSIQIEIFDYIASHEECNQKIFYDGQIFDAYSLLNNMIGKADNSIILIDGYVDLTTLNILAKKKSNVDICIYTLPNTRLTMQDIVNFNAQYPKLEVKRTSAFHDRF